VIVNRGEAATSAKLSAEAQANPLVAAVISAAEACAQPFEIESTSGGLEMLARTPLPGGLPNRARMKIFSPRPGHLLVFFYKRGLVPYSRDRYSYGGIDLRPPSAEPQEVTSWLAFLTSGFHPDQRPERLRRAFPYEIPE